MTEMFEAIVTAGADPQWVAEGMRVSMFDTLYRAMTRRKYDEWEQCRMAAILPAMAAGAKIKFDDFKNPWEIKEDEHEPTAEALAEARKKLKKLKYESK